MWSKSTLATSDAVHEIFEIRRASGKVITLGPDVIRPFYKAKADFAVDIIRSEFADVDCHIHKPEGAIFLWLWFEGLPITCMELYERLKRRGVFVVPGNFVLLQTEMDKSFETGNLLWTVMKGICYGKAARAV